MIRRKDIKVYDRFFELSTNEAFKLYSTSLFLFKLFEKYGYTKNKELYYVEKYLGFGVRADKIGEHLKAYDIGYYFPDKYFFVRGKSYDYSGNDIEIKDIEKILEKNKDKL